MTQNYVEAREAQLKAQFQAEMWWIRMGKFFKMLGETMKVKREADYYSGEFNKIRAQYIRRGRKAQVAG